jgi:hypothetical protein
LNKDPYKARLKRWEKQYPVPIERLQAQAYAVLQLALEGVAVKDPEQRRKNILAYCQALSTFAKFQESAEFEARLRETEALLGLGEGNGHVPS